MTRVEHAERTERGGHAGAVVWFTGLSGAGKSTLAFGLERVLFAGGHACYVLDGDRVRTQLTSDLGFSLHDRSENVRRTGEVARLLTDAGMIAMVALISPLRADRHRARELWPVGRFVEVHVNAPLAVCERRDTKGLYARARAGAIADFTGISSPYEPPLRPELELRTAELSVEECVARVVHELRNRELLRQGI